MAKALIVIDKDFRFSTAVTADFTFTALVDALTSAGHQVTKAHRGDHGNVDPNADIPMFNFATTTSGRLNLHQYDVIWLIGRAGRNEPPPSSTSSGLGIGDDEIRAIAEFMEAGGGVFATGDHDSIGAEMCGKIPRIRAMRTWYGVGDSASPMLDNFPRNFPLLGTTPLGMTSAGTTRADTTQRSPNSDYGGDANLVWFENQSDSLPQTITPTPAMPAHPILRRNGADIVVYPDHMHEGNALGDVTMMAGFHYDYTQTLPFDGKSFVEFKAIGADRPMPQVIARGQSLAHKSGFAASNTVIDSTTADVKTVNALSAYDGRNVGVGRIVTGSTFHHYIDINLTGDSTINDMTHPGSVTRAGIDAEKGHGYNDAPAAFADIKAVYDNITNWLARPRRAIQLILERSTFSSAEANAHSDFIAAIFITVDGLKPNQFPGSGVTSLDPMLFQAAWAPTITPSDPTGLEITATAVNSDDILLHDRLQRLTFTYHVHFTDVVAAFNFMQTKNIQIDAALTLDTVSAPLTDSAVIQLVNSPNPFMLDLDGGNQTVWLSSDVKVFPVIAGAPGSGLVNEASRDDAISYLKMRLMSMTDGEFNLLTGDEEGSALSPVARTTGSMRKVYNFAIARVRLDPASAPAHGVHVFFRIVPSPTTASLTYHESMGVPVGSYLETGGVNTIALPGKDGAESEWWSFPCFLHTRISPPASQIDDNPTDFAPGHSFVGALIDNNLADAYLPLTPAGGAAVGLPTLLMGEHQCLVVQIRDADTPIPDGASPFTSDKLSQRNLAFSTIANPGLDASRVAFHTFEIEATPRAIGGGILPDELLLQWHKEPPEGVEVRLEISTWDAPAVVELADRFYPRHEIRALGAHTIAVPGGGVRYLPIPPSYIRQTGVIAVDFPLGVKKGQRFDVSVHQVTTRGRQVDVASPKATKISREEAARLLKTPGSAATLPRGVFDLGDNKVLITDLRVLDDTGDHAFIVEHPDPKEVAKAQREAARWRETIGAFQLGIPVSHKAEMLAHHLRLLSVLRWRAEWLRPNSRWYATFNRYVEMTAEKVRALGGDPFSVPATPDGDVPLPERSEDYSGCSGCLLSWMRPLVRWYKRA